MHISSMLASLAFTGLSVATSASSGCSSVLVQDTPQPGESKTINLNGRSFILYLPGSYNHRVPSKVHFSYHGVKGTGQHQMNLTGLTDPNVNNDTIAIFPNGINKKWLTNIHADPQVNTDLDFTKDMVEYVDQHLCVGRDRIYASGKSNGGSFAAALAYNAEVGDQFAAFASVSGAYYDPSVQKGVGPCRAPRRSSGVPFIEFHGLNDTTAPYYGGGEGDKLPTRHMVGSFLEYNGCSRHEKGTVQAVPYHTIDTDGKNIDTNYWHGTWGCDGKEDIVEHYKENDMGHCWPSTNTNSDFEEHWRPCLIGHYAYNATQIIIEFFAKHPR